MYYTRLENTGGSVPYIFDVEGVAPAMGGFSLEFNNSDNHIGGLTVGGVTYNGEGTASYQAYLFRFGDQDGGDPYNLSAKYIDLGAEPTLTARGRGVTGGAMRAAIPPLGENDLFVLRGFDISAPRGRNHHIRTVGVRFDYRTNTISVTFRDDSPSDDRFSFEVHYFVVPHVNATGPRHNPHFEGPFTETFSFINSTTEAKSNPGIALLAGFEFSYDDHDHHLKKIAIDLEPNDQIRATFTDDERDNSVSASIDYVLVKPFIL